jgi:hypothetical protein
MARARAAWKSVMNASILERDEVSEYSHSKEKSSNALHRQW